MNHSSLPSIRADSLKLKMPDERLLIRFHRVKNSLEQGPHQSFPALFPKKSQLEGFYRFVNNDRVEFSNLIKSTCDETVRAASQEDIVLAIHDTTDFCFPADSPIEGIGRTSRKKKGFFGHFCIAGKLNREIIGLLGLCPWVRGKKNIGKRSQRQLQADPRRESLRWARMIHEVQNKLNPHPNVIHVTDREGDDYTTYCSLLKQGVRFIIRASHNRNLTSTASANNKSDGLFDCLNQSKIICQKQAPISARKLAGRPKDRKVHPERKKRIATLGVCAKAVEIDRGGHASRNLPNSLNIHFVRVFEIDPPRDQPPIEWRLITTEPIQTAEDLLRIVDIYCARWTIEEYFKALKTGCSFEKRGLESLHGLLNCLALFAPIAVKLYNLKVIGRQDPERKSGNILNPTQVAILAAFTEKPEQQLQTYGSLMGAVACLGGHLKHNGLPGWQVMARGYEKLLQLEAGWIMASQKARVA